MCVCQHSSSDVYGIRFFSRKRSRLLLSESGGGGRNLPDYKKFMNILTMCYVDGCL